jgi:hypothetical protein
MYDVRNCQEWFTRMNFVQRTKKMTEQLSEDRISTTQLFSHSIIQLLVMPSYESLHARVIRKTKLSV